MFAALSSHPKRIMIWAPLGVKEGGFPFLSASAWGRRRGPPLSLLALLAAHSDLAAALRFFLSHHLSCSRRPLRGCVGTSPSRRCPQPSCHKTVVFVSWGSHKGILEKGRKLTTEYPLLLCPASLSHPYPAGHPFPTPQWAVTPKKKVLAGCWQMTTDQTVSSMKSGSEFPSPKTVLSFPQPWGTEWGLRKPYNLNTCGSSSRGSWCPQGGQTWLIWTRIFLANGFGFFCWFRELPQGQCPRHIPRLPKPWLKHVLASILEFTNCWWFQNNIFWCPQCVGYIILSSQGHGLSLAL